MLLEINYYQGTGQVDECWLTVGVAVRLAQALGLHRKLPQNTTVAPIMQRLYSRLWWGCYYLVRFYLQRRDLNGLYKQGSFQSLSWLCTK